MIILQMGKRRCDESCYDAKHVNCHCICGGANHGLGLQHALDHAQEVADKVNALMVDDEGEEEDSNE